MKNTIATPVMFRNHPIGFLITVLLTPLGVGALIFIYWYLSNKTTKLSVSDGKVFYEVGLFSKAVTDVDVNAIRSMRIKQTFAERIFGVGSLSIYTAGDKPEIRIKGIRNPLVVKELLV